jgi:formylglycine-generating enzyme required for sulfatase activity
MRVLVFLAMTVVLANLTYANDFKIVSFSTSGELAWQDTNSNGTYTVQWTPSLQDNKWRSDWSGLTQIAATGGIITAKVPMFYRILYRPRLIDELVLISGGGQSLGPSYDFYMAKYEVRNEEFAQFLNDAQMNPTTTRGTNTYYAVNGKVYCNIGLSSSTLLFDTSVSKILYNPAAAIGSRYTVHPQYLGHPIVGVSWFGCVKYCNWLTISSGRGEEQRCYSEGANYADWRPVHLTSAQWTDGFDFFERQSWVLNYKGFRLPQWDSIDTASDYSEWYKAAAWCGTSNVLYGFGRSSYVGKDANYPSSGDPYETSAIGTTPVGYYNGSVQDGTYQTASNGNYYGIYDLTGNVWEWTNDSLVDHAKRLMGGGWKFGPYPNNASYENLQNYGADNNTGFRVVTTSP